MVLKASLILSFPLQEPGLLPSHRQNHPELRRSLSINKSNLVNPEINISFQTEKTPF